MGLVICISSTLVFKIWNHDLSEFRSLVFSLQCLKSQFVPMMFPLKCVSVINMFLDLKPHAGIQTDKTLGIINGKKYGFQITRFHFRAKKQTFHTFHRFKFHIFTSSAYPCSTFKPTIVLHRTSSHHPFQRQNIGPGAASAQQPGARGADELGPAGGSHQRAGGGGKVGAGRNTGPGEPSSHWMVFERKMPSFEMDDDWG